MRKVSRVNQTLSRIGVLLAAMLVLGLSPLGFIDISGPGRAITLLHIPVLLAATLEGPLAAACLGAVFGLIAGVSYPVPGIALGFHIVGRLIAGLVAALTFQVVATSSWRDSRITIGSVAAVLAGTLANTLIMTLLVLLLAGASPEELLSVAIIHGLVEVVVAMVAVVPITIVLLGSRS